MSWTRDAKCQDMPKNFFYPDDGPGADRAAAFCWGVGPDGMGPCPVRLECLLWAITENETLGVWGGYGQRDRVRIRREWAMTGRLQDLPEVKVLVKKSTNLNPRDARRKLRTASA